MNGGRFEAETDLKAVQERLGHTKYSTTADLYGHVTKKVRKQTAAKLDKFDPANNIRQQSVNKS
jgi:integrase